MSHETFLRIAVTLLAPHQVQTSALPRYVAKPSPRAWALGRETPGRPELKRASFLLPARAVARYAPNPVTGDSPALARLLR
jgi:hypothetical protein